MNKEKLAVLAAIAMSFATMPALAEEAGNAMNMAPAHAQDSGQGQGQGGQGGQELSPQKFEALKAVMLQHIKQREACVAAAADPQALRECMMPGGAGGGEGGGMMMHGGRAMPKGNMGGSQDSAPPASPQGDGQ